MKELAPAQDIFVEQFKPVQPRPKQGDAPRLP